MKPSLEGWPTKAKEVPSPHEVRMSPLETNPVFQSLRGENKSCKKALFNFASFVNVTESIKNLNLSIFCSSHFYIYSIFFMCICCGAFLFCLIIYFSLNSCFIFISTVLFNNLIAFFEETLSFTWLKARNKMFVLHLWKFSLLNCIQHKNVQL